MESVHRALVLLKLLIEEGSLGVLESAEALGVNASTAQRLLATLAQDGFAVQSRDRRYHLGPALHSPALTGGASPLIDRLRPALESAFDRSGETVHLATLVGTRIQHIDGIEATSHMLRFGHRVGQWLPAHITAGGKALLADLSDDEVEARYKLLHAGSATGLSADVPALLSTLADVRTRRVAWNLEQSEPGIAAVGISIGAPGAQRAALSIAAPIARFTRELGERWTSDLIAIADAVAEGRRP